MPCPQLSSGQRQVVNSAFACEVRQHLPAYKTKVPQLVHPFFKIYDKQPSYKKTCTDNGFEGAWPA